jgi:hypothetical protein
MKKNKMRLTLRVMAHSGLIWKLNTSFSFFTMKLITIFIFENVLPNHGIQHKMKQQNSLITKQMQHKFKLEEIKINVFQKT